VRNDYDRSRASMKNPLMKTPAVVALIYVLACSLAAQEQRPPARATIAEIAWLAGNWSGRTGGTELEERWTKPAGGTMLAVSRTLKDSRMAGFEFLRIVERAGGLVYIAQPGGRPPTEFAATEIGSRRVAFENPSHDFPKRIEYTLNGDTLTATISGGGQQESYVFKRAE
jgi:hypothetical protein